MGEEADDNGNVSDKGINAGHALNFRKAGGNILPAETYYLAETDAPDGYKRNEAVTETVVDSTGVYADAGNDSDGVDVLQGAGSIVKAIRIVWSPPTEDTAGYLCSGILRACCRVVCAGEKTSEEKVDNVGQRGIGKR